MAYLEAPQFFRLQCPSKRESFVASLADAVRYLSAPSSGRRYWSSSRPFEARSKWATCPCFSSFCHTVLSHQRPHKGLKQCIIREIKDLERCGGSGEIRTHERVPPSAVFKTAAFNHSATLPEEPALYINHCPTGSKRTADDAASPMPISSQFSRKLFSNSYAGSGFPYR